MKTKKLKDWTSRTSMVTSHATLASMITWAEERNLDPAKVRIEQWGHEGDSVFMNANDIVIKK